MSVIERAYGIYSLDTSYDPSPTVFDLVDLTERRIFFRVEDQYFEGLGYFKITAARQNS